MSYRVVAMGEFCLMLDRDRHDRYVYDENAGAHIEGLGWEWGHGFSESSSEIFEDEEESSELHEEIEEPIEAPLLSSPGASPRVEEARGDEGPGPAPEEETARSRLPTRAPESGGGAASSAEASVKINGFLYASFFR